MSIIQYNNTHQVQPMPDAFIWIHISSHHVEDTVTTLIQMEAVLIDIIIVVIIPMVMERAGLPEMVCTHVTYRMRMDKHNPLGSLSTQPQVGRH